MTTGRHAAAFSAGQRVAGAEWGAPSRSAYDLTLLAALCLGYGLA